MSPSDEDLTGSEAEKADTTPEATATEPGDGRRGILIVSVAVVVVLAVAGVVVYLLTSGEDSADNAGQARDVPTITGSPAPTTPDPTTSAASVAPPATVTGEVDAAESLAEQAASAISNSDVDTLNQLSCDPANPATDDTFPADAKARVVGEPKVEGDTATIDIELTIANSEPTVVPMPLTKRDGRWCIPS